MPRQILHAAPEIREEPERGMLGIAPGVDELPPKRVGRIDELELIHHLGQPIDLRRIDPQRFSQLHARRCVRGT